MGKSIKVICWAGICAVALVCSITSFIIYGFGWGSKPEKSDCIIVLGCSVYGSEPSPFLAGRTDEGIRLYKEGYGKYLIFSGGKGPGENLSEAEAMKRYAVDRGVDSKDIIIEDKSKSTYENIILSKKIMDENGFKAAIVVSNKFHLKRASLMCKKLGVDGYFSGVFLRQHKISEIKGFIREIPALLKFYILKK